MNYSVVNSYFFSLSFNKNLLYTKDHNLWENALLIFRDYVNNSKDCEYVIINTGPGSATSIRNTLAFFYGLRGLNNFKIFYCDTIRDIMLSHYQNKLGAIAITKNKLVLGSFDECGRYIYQFVLAKELSEILKKKKITFDKSFDLLTSASQEVLLQYKENINFINWDSKTMYQCNLFTNYSESIISYSFW